jgi:hypothetical protein
MKSWLRTEDGLAVVIGLTLIAAAALPLLGVDSFGWVAKTNVWMDPVKAVTPASRGFAPLPGPACLALTYVFLLSCCSSALA